MRLPAETAAQYYSRTNLWHWSMLNKSCPRSCPRFMTGVRAVVCSCLKRLTYKICGNCRSSMKTAVVDIPIWLQIIAAAGRQGNRAGVPRWLGKQLNMDASIWETEISVSFLFIKHQKCFPLRSQSLLSMFQLTAKIKWQLVSCIVVHFQLNGNKVTTTSTGQEKS